MLRALTFFKTCLRAGLDNQIPARRLDVASVANVTLAVIKSDTYNVINIGGGGGQLWDQWMGMFSPHYNYRMSHTVDVLLRMF